MHKFIGQRAAAGIIVCLVVLGAHGYAIAQDVEELFAYALERSRFHIDRLGRKIDDTRALRLEAAADERYGIEVKVAKMSLVSTSLLTVDNQLIVIPNNKIWGDIIKNITAQDVRRVDMVFGISYSDDIPKSLFEKCHFCSSSRRMENLAGGIHRVF
jgi:small conductance mechanosensitive channel